MGIFKGLMIDAIGCEDGRMEGWGTHWGYSKEEKRILESKATPGRRNSTEEIQEGAETRTSGCRYVDLHGADRCGGYGRGRGICGRLRSRGRTNAGGCGRGHGPKRTNKCERGETAELVGRQEAEMI